MTNVVKHFKFAASGKRRIHSKPDAVEIRACRQWLDGELALVDPKLTVRLDATAAKALIGPSFRVTKQRGQLLQWPGGEDGKGEGNGRQIMATLHPSAILRMDDEDREAGDGRARRRPPCRSPHPALSGRSLPER